MCACRVLVQKAAVMKHRAYVSNRHATDPETLIEQVSRFLGPERVACKKIRKKAESEKSHGILHGFDWSNDRKQS